MGLQITEVQSILFLIQFFNFRICLKDEQNSKDQVVFVFKTFRKNKMSKK